MKIDQTTVDLLAVTIDECDRITVDEEHRNDLERTKGGYSFDAMRLEHYAARRRAIRTHRLALIEIYVRITGTDPWKDTPL